MTYKWLHLMICLCMSDTFQGYSAEIPREITSDETERILHKLSEYITLQEKSLSNVERLINEVDAISPSLNHEDLTSETAAQTRKQALSLKATLIQAVGEIRRFENVSLYDCVIGEIKDHYDDPPFNFDAEDFLHLQSVYNLKTEVLASGVLRKSYSLPLTALECMVLAQAAYRMGDHFLAAEWSTEAKHRVYTEIQPSVNVPTLLHTLAVSASQANNPWAAAKLLVELLEMFPGDDDVLYQCEELLSKVTTAIFNVTTSEWIRIQTLSNERGRNAMSSFNRLCRGFFIRDASPSLKCTYSDLGAPWLRLQPFKIEILSLDPVLKILHTVFTDHQVEQLKHIDAEENKQRKEKFKHLLSSMVSDEELGNVHFTIQRHTVTGKENYPIHFGKGKHVTNGVCPVNNYKSLEIFLNNVEGGGAVIYPSLEKVILPKKCTVVIQEGSAYEEPGLQQHCPLLLGEKWTLHAVYNHPVMYR